ncbi:S8 family peptidase [Nitrosomonas sp.]|uniref:S8 family peptidase n=1 Tax=Nitrosomonas sp. TaxID=42353 RepID=UPI0026159753|nr:S8 family peptidase [Nitrosomonas sp.]
MPYEHLRFSRELPLTDRHRRRFPGVRPPADPHGHVQKPQRDFARAVEQATQQDLGGYDERLLIKIQLRHGATVPELSAIVGVELVSQEDKSIILAFADRAGLAEFESRLSTLARDGKATRADLLYALQDFGHWTPEDRTGVALRQQGFPELDTFMLDVELWPQDRADRRDAMLTSFLAQLRERNIEQLDDLKQPSLVMVRLRCSREQAESFLLRHRDVRTVDLPPRTGVTVDMVRSDINEIPQTQQPPADAPIVAMLDAGIAAGHPLLAPAVGDAQGFLPPPRHAYDNPPYWHGTFVSGLALYSDVENCLNQRNFVPQLRLLSGKVFEDDGHDQTEFVEKAVEEAVREFHAQYGCRIFNLSYGDRNKVYDGRHVRGLAYTLDRLTRELSVLFVVPTGNLTFDELPDDPRRNYPDYLLKDSVRLLDPAPALNVLTVGGIAHHTATRDAQNYPNQIEALPVAQEAQPFPLTRRGPSINGAIKPDLVEHAGNIAVTRMGGRIQRQGLGLLSICGDFANGRPFAEDIGTSYATPQVVHRAARLLAEVPDASHNLLRALLGAHARWPQATIELINNNNQPGDKERLLQLIGYGRIDDEALYRSLDQTVTLLAEEQIENDKCHFYELPIPDSFWSRGRRAREITVALAYSPDIRTT